MKPVSLPVEKVTLVNVLKKASHGQVVFLTKEGEVRFAVTQADDMDREAAALRSNSEFMAYLARSKVQAHARPGKTLAEMRELYGKPQNRRQAARKTNGKRRGA